MVKILMFGWEFPPMKSGGLGTACYDLCKGLSKLNAKITFVMPNLSKDIKCDFVKLKGTNMNIKIKKIKSLLTPYLNSEEYLLKYESYEKKDNSIYGKNLMEEVEKYTLNTHQIIKDETFDIIHTHDWMTYKSGIIAKKKSKKPLVAHIHATEHDRTGGNPNLNICKIEHLGLKEADLIIANSNYTKNNVIKEYKIDPDKIKVIHWGIDDENPAFNLNFEKPFSNEKIILSLGRITIQKGVDYFVKTAELVSKHVNNVKFVISGDGHMLPSIIEDVANKGLSNKFIFTGFLNGDEVHKMFQMADLYVMPSVSEPFGLVALESIKNNTPVLISKQSGVSEVLNHSFKVDFWDVEEMANKIISYLKYPELELEFKKNSFEESKKFNILDPAKKCIDCYKEVLSW